MLTRASLRLRFLLIFAGLSVMLGLVLVLGLWLSWYRLGQQAGALDALVQGGLVIGFPGLAALVWVWLQFDRHLARPVETLAGALRTGQAPTGTETRFLGDLGPAVRHIAEARAHAGAALAQAIDEHAAEIRHDRDRLQEILADFGAGAVMADQRGRVVFYNEAALQFLPGLALDRLLARYLGKSALKAAEARLAAGNEATDLVILSPEGAPVTGRIRQLADARLLILRSRDEGKLSHERIEILRRHAATLVPMLDALEGPMPPALAKAIRDAGQGLAAALRSLSQDMAEDRGPSRATLAELSAGLPGASRLPALSVQAEAGPMNALLLFLDHRLRGIGVDPSIRAASPEDGEVPLILEWRGDALPVDLLERWLALSPDPALPDLSGDAILSAHATGIWPEGRYGQARLVVPLRIAAEPAAQGGIISGFSLSRRAVASTRLSDLTCVVFDTETTGLDPASDRIVQIAGVRIAGGRLTGEGFDTLVNPGRAIPALVTEIHRITDAMVAAAPDMHSALSAFRHFSEDSVLIAHNAPFDMGLLRAAGGESGVVFPNPVLDTVLLSAMLWGQSAPHDLDALTQRLAITIPPGRRHDAMGDAQATAEVFLKLVPALAAKGIVTLEDVAAETRRHRRLIADANPAAI